MVDVRGVPSFIYIDTFLIFIRKQGFRAVLSVFYDTDDDKHKIIFVNEHDRQSARGGHSLIHKSFHIVYVILLYKYI